MPNSPLHSVNFEEDENAALGDPEPTDKYADDSVLNEGDEPSGMDTTPPSDSFEGPNANSTSDSASTPDTIKSACRAGPSPDHQAAGSLSSMALLTADESSGLHPEDPAPTDASGSSRTRSTGGGSTTCFDGSSLFGDDSSSYTTEPEDSATATTSQHPKGRPDKAALRAAAAARSASLAAKGAQRRKSRGKTKPHLRGAKAQGGEGDRLLPPVDEPSSSSGTRGTRKSPRVPGGAKDSRGTDAGPVGSGSSLAREH